MHVSTMTEGLKMLRCGYVLCKVLKSTFKDEELGLQSNFVTVQWVQMIIKMLLGNASR